MPRSSALVVLVVVARGLIGCSSGGDDGVRAGEECSRGPTTAACDECVREACPAKYEAAFHDPLLGDRTNTGACVDQARCVAHCPCGDGACYDRCPPGIRCSAALFELRNCEAARCPIACHYALVGVGGACIDLLACCSSPRLPDVLRGDCRNVAANGKVADPGGSGCEERLSSYRRDDYCD